MEFLGWEVNLFVLALEIDSNEDLDLMDWDLMIAEATFAAVPKNEKTVH